MSGEGGAQPDPSAETVLRPSDDAAKTRIAGASPAAGAAPDRFGRYELRGTLGQGAMGTVYRAFDTHLKREVALKLVRLQPGESDELFQRFRLEAEAAAKLRHPNLVAVFDLGTEGGQPFMTMELLEGGSLARRLRERGGRLAPNEAMRMVRDVARGVACAHEKGIVHRDLKPENILLDGDSPKVSDFGLAHSVGRPGDARLTLHGTILGTPVYMAPEQAEGDLDRVDARSDVYALGAVLYEAASGSPAYAGTDPMKVILEKITSDPPPPHGLGRDLETIIMKSMARDPGQRYATAKELAEDLDRCLSGAAILARPESAMEGAMRRLRRHRALAAGSLVVVVALGLAGAAAWRSSLDRREQKRVEEEALGFLRNVVQTNLRASLILRRAGRPVSEQEPFLAGVEEAARKAIERMPASPEPHYQLGRMHRALQRFDAALADQDLAVGKDAAYGPARYERALLELRLWESRLAELRAAWSREEGRRLAKSGQLEKSGKAPEPPPDVELAAGDAEASKLRDRIAGDLDSLERSSPGGASCLRGLVQLHGATEEKRAEGARLVETALAGDPTLEEAWEGLAQEAQARGDFGEAISQYTRGIEKDAGYVPFFLGRASAATAQAERERSFGGDPVSECRQAVEDLGRALQLDPVLTEARWSRGKILCLWGDHLGESGGDPKPKFEAAEADLSAAVTAQPDRAEMWLARGKLFATWGSWQQDHGEDPGERDGRAIEDLDVAIRKAPLSPEAWGARGDVRRRWGLYEKNCGGDPREKYRAATDDYTQALTLDPRSVPLWTSRSTVRQGMSVFTRLRGDPWREYVDGALADYGRALELEPRSTWILGLRAQVDMLLGACQVQDGDDPAEVFGRAIADLDTLLKEQPSPVPLIARASIRVQWAEHEFARGRAAAPLLALARQDLDSARAEAFGKFQFGVELGRLEILEARMGDALRHVQAAREALAETLRQNPESTEAYMRLGVAGSVEGSWRAARGEDPGPAWSKAEEDFAKAIAINPRWEDVWLHRGRLCFERLKRSWSPGKGDVELENSAIQYFKKVVEVNPAFVDGWVALAEAKRWLVESGDMPARELDGALADLDRAVKLGPNHAGARLERARIRLALGDARGAIEDIDKAAERAPAWKDECARLRELAARPR